MSAFSSPRLFSEFVAFGITWEEVEVYDSVFSYLDHFGMRGEDGQMENKSSS